MKLKITLLIAAFASLFASAIYAGRATDGNAKIIYWQAPSILNPYLSSGTKDIESASLVTECDSLMLGQFSMGRVAQKIINIVEKPVLTAPECAVKKMKRLMEV